MKNIEKIIGTIKQQGVVALFYHDELEVCVQMIDALYEAGIKIIEFTNRGNKALENFSALQQTRSRQWNDLILSVGTIKNAEEAKQFINAGADFIICPGVIPAVAKTVQDADLLWVPGCMTSTEIIIAEQHGAQLIKLFPGNLLGPSYVSALKEIFPALMFMPTGGVEVTEENIKAWFKAGVVAVGLGSKVISKELLRNKEYASIAALAQKALSIVQSVNTQQ